MRTTVSIVSFLGLTLLLSACATMPPERAARREMLEAAARECQRSFPVVVRVEVDPFDQLVAWYRESISEKEIDPFWQCVADRIRQQQLGISTTSGPPAVPGERWTGVSADEAVDMLTKAQDSATAETLRGDGARWQSVYRGPNREWLMDVNRVARQGTLWRFYTLNFEGRFAYELVEVVTYWELNCSTGDLKRLERARYALNAREVGRERPSESEEVPTGLAKALVSLCS